MTEQRTDQDLRQRAAEATQEADRLARRMTAIDGEIEAEKENIKARRVMAAKAGESPIQAADRDTLEELEAERDELPELHFAARLNAAAAHLAVEEARIAELEPEVAQAEDDLRPLQRAAAEAQAKADTQAHILSHLYGELEAAKAASRRHNHLLKRVEDEGPREVY